MSDANETVCNAAAMREALENSNGLLEELANIGEWGESAKEQIAENNAALAAPARNCDRFRTLDDFSMADSPIDTPLTNATREQLYKVIRWLFAPAEGGAE